MYGANGLSAGMSLNFVGSGTVLFKAFGFSECSPFFAVNPATFQASFSNSALLIVLAG